MTLNDILSLIKANVKTSLTDSQLTQFVNDAYHELGGIYPIQESAAISTAANTQEYSLPADFRRALFVKDSSKTLGYITPERLARLGSQISATGAPTNYYILGVDKSDGNQKIGLVPIPSAVGSVTLYYVAAPTDLSAGTDVPKLPSVYHQLLVFYGTARAAEVEGEQDVANRYMTMYTAGKENMKLDAVVRDYGADVAAMMAQRS